jgi:hypothetical protein
MNEQVSQAEPTVTVTLTASQFNVVMAGLNELPFKVVGNFIPELVKQVQAQVQQAQVQAEAEVTGQGPGPSGPGSKGKRIED